jgi:hypothetical protein
MVMPLVLLSSCGKRLEVGCLEVGCLEVYEFMREY